MRQATEAELPHQTGPDSGASTATAAPATTAAPSPPRSIVEPANTTPVVVEVAKTDVSDNEVGLRGTLPDGVDFTLAVLVLADGVQVTGQNGGRTVLHGPLPADQQVQLVGAGSGETSLLGALAVTSDPTARYVEVLRSNGLRYRAELTATKAHPETRIGAVLVPEAEVVSGSLLDADGRVITTTTFGH